MNTVMPTQCEMEYALKVLSRERDEMMKDPTFYLQAGDDLAQATCMIAWLKANLTMMQESTEEL